MKLRLRVLTNDEHEAAIKRSGFLFPVTQNVAGVGEQPLFAYGVLEMCHEGSIPERWHTVPYFIDK